MDLMGKFTSELGTVPWAQIYFGSHRKALFVVLSQFLMLGLATSKLEAPKTGTHKNTKKHKDPSD